MKRRTRDSPGWCSAWGVSTTTMYSKPSNQSTLACFHTREAVSPGAGDQLRRGFSDSPFSRRSCLSVTFGSEVCSSDADGSVGTRQTHAHHLRTSARCGLRHVPTMQCLSSTTEAQSPERLKMTANSSVADLKGSFCASIVNRYFS